MAQSCFIFECYCEGRMLFRASSESSGLPDPVPDTSFARALQAEAIRKRLRLTYFYIATGLTKSEASILMRRMAADEVGQTTDARHTDANHSVEVEWLPGSGVSRLPSERRPAVVPINSAPVPLEN